MDIKIVLGYDYKDEIRNLFNEYTNMLIENDSKFEYYLKLQNYEEELNTLDIKYGLPYGRLFVVLVNNKVTGSIALKKIDNENCELKRLYVKKEYRGLKLGTLLTKKLIEEAKSIGYKHILLDTYPFLTSAINIYRNLGFYDIPIYNNNPISEMIYLKLDL